ncbi:MAG: hypothetical protein ACRCSN_20685 [Dermatophilaceae bacterium]
MADDALLDGLDRLRGTGPEFDGFLANHGPMAVEALTRLDAADAVPAWVERYRPRLAPAANIVRGIDPDDWREALGDVRLAGDWAALLLRQAAETSWEALLATWWPRLLPGMAASATHGVIRVAHAVRSLASSDREPDRLLVDELAHGLALWAARYQTVPGAPHLRGRHDATGALALLPRLAPGAPPRGPGVMGRISVLPDVDGFPEGLEEWGAPVDADDALDDLVLAGARVLSARDDVPIAFCHAVTAPAAVRLVLPHLPPALAIETVAVSWQVVGAIVSAFGSPREPAESTDPPTLPDDELVGLVPQAVEHGDEHVIKLTEATLREHARTGEATLLVAARRFRDRVEPQT